jgi:molecular chaperone DnaK
MPVVGIDLGTTYSEVAVLDEMKKPVVVPNAEANNTTPSVVFFEDKNNIVVGEHAKNSSEAYPDMVVQFVKNHMGFAGDGHTWNFFGEIYGPEKISAIILRKLKKDAEASLGKLITGAVITVPAIFGEQQRNATKEAAEIAGIEVIAILDEPVAAALNYGLARGAGTKTQNILVFDLGGGTFDLTIMRVSENSIAMLYTGGDRMLGGKLWDDKIIEYVAAGFMEKYLSDPQHDKYAYQNLRIAAEHAKRQLTQMKKAAISCDHNGQTLRVEITRDKFEELTADLLARTETITDLALEAVVEKEGLRGWEDVHHVLLVGGSSKMPQISALLKRLSGKEPELFEPDLAVAKGAALFSEMELLRVARVTGDDSNLRVHGLTPGDAVLLPKAKISRVCSFAVGTKFIKNWSGQTLHPDEYEYGNEVLIPRNTSLPAKGKGTFSTIVPDQRRILVTVLDGDNPDPAHCDMLGEGVIKDIPTGLPAGSPMDVTFELTEESLIHVTAIETTHGTSVTFEVQRDVGLSPAAVKRAAQELACKTVA